MSFSKFEGFSADLPAFLAELRENPGADWMGRNEQRYVAFCVEPCLQFITEIAPKLAQFDPPHLAIAEPGKSFRSRQADAASTSGTHLSYLHLVFWAGAEALISPSLHLVLSAGGLGVGAGQWHFNDDQVIRYHQALHTETALAALLEAITTAKDAGCHLEKPQTRVPPDGISLTGQARQLAMHTGLVVRNRNEAYNRDIFSARCVDMLCKRMENLLPLQKWLMEYVYEIR